MRGSLLLLRWKIKATYRCQGLGHFVSRSWHWSAKWPWFTGLFVVAFALISLGEYAFSATFFFLSALGIFSKLLHWDADTVNPTRGIYLKIGGSALIWAVAAVLIYSLNAEKGTRTWSHLQPPLERIIAGKWFPLSADAAKIPILPFNLHPPPGPKIERVERLPSRSQPKKPDLIADFVGPTDLQMVISNQGEQTAHQTAYQTVLVDEDNMGAGLLPIGREIGTYLRASASFLRITLLHYGNNASLNVIRPNDRLLGYVTLTCEDCERIRWYWVYYENQKGGWYAESDTEPDSKEFITEARNPGHLDRLVPLLKRHAIEEKTGIVRYPEQGTFH